MNAGIRPAPIAKTRTTRWSLSDVTPSSRNRILMFLSLAITLALWEYAGRNINRLLFAPPSEILAADWVLLQTRPFWDNFASTAQGLVIGFALASSFGIVVGLLSGRYAVFDALTKVQIMSLYVTPHVALIPLLIIWFGLELQVRVAIVFLMCVFPVLITTHDGVKAIGDEIIEVARAEGASEWQILRKFVLPASIPYIVTGLRLGIGRAVVAMVFAEMLTSVSGLGGAIIRYGNMLDTQELLAVVIVLTLIGYALTQSVGLVEKYFAKWRLVEPAR